MTDISIHALREEGDNFLLRTWHKADDFYPRPPRGGRPSTASTFTLTAYFYPRPPRGGRQLPQWVTTMIMNFYPRPPRGGRPLQIRLDETADRFLSTPSARRATFQVWPHLLGNPISIHALREEGDIQRRTGAVAHRISIHALREEGDPCQPDHRAGNLGFLSTPSARRATIPFSATLSLPMYFYPRPPRGGRQFFPVLPEQSIGFLSTPSARRATAHKCPHCAGLHISIHALREEGDLPWLSLCSAIGKFLSTPSARRATDAPLIWATSLMYFYPRPLRGGRQPSVSAPGCNYIFLSTPSARRATGESCHRGCRRDISIHALCEEGDA